jgi:hypothetical protein
MGYTCKDCGQMFISFSDYRRHEQTHLQTHLYRSNKQVDRDDGKNENKDQSKITRKSPEGMNPALFKVFEKYDLENKAVLCFWHNGQLNTAIREPYRMLELQDRLREWLSEIRTVSKAD